MKIYFDGTLAAEGASNTGVANIKSSVDVKLGHHTRHTPTTQYEDLRIYHAALNTAEIQALIPPVSRPLREGEIELVATDGAAVILRKDAKNLFRFSREFQTLRVGPDTRVSLFKEVNFGGTGQRVYVDLPDIKQSRLKNFPASVRIRSAIGEPFTGKWLIKAPNGQFLNLINAPLRNIKSVLTTSPERSFNVLFKLRQQSKQSRIQLVHDAHKEHTLFRLFPETEAIPLFVEELRPLTGEFAIVNQAKDQWLEMGEKNTFKWTDREEKRAIFARVAKMADDENQVGELATGEVALYQHVAYHGRTWILSDTEKDLSGEYPNLSVFQSLQDETSSIRLGPETGVTVFREDKFHGSLEEKPAPQFDRARRLEGRKLRGFRNIREKIKEVAEKAQEAVEKAQEAAKSSLVEDIVKNIPNLFDSQIGNDTISSLKIFRTVAPEDIFASYTTKLSQDYRLVGDKLEEFSAYRTTLRFEPDSAGEVEVSATDLTTIEVEGTTHEIDEVQSVTLQPNELNFIMITSEADGLNTPGLKIRTRDMAPNEQVVIFPNQEVHQHIVELEDDALWNATDAQGNLIVDRNAHSQAEVASVQNTIKRVTATVAFKDSRVQTSSPVVSGAAIADPWELKFDSSPDNLGRNVGLQRVARTAALRADGASTEAASPLSGGIHEEALSQNAFAQLLSQATSSEAAPISAPSGKDTQLPGAIGFGGARRVGGIRRLRIGRRIRDAVKKATSVVVGAVKGVVHFVVKTAEEVIDFVIDTAEKVAEFGEAVVEKVVNGIKKFIEFLQFLFNWDDILDTQRYLIRTINAGLDSATQLAESAKKPVSDFIDDLQDTVEDGMNNLVKLLDGNPSAAKTFEFKLPEAAEWFLSKLFGGLKQSGANPIPSAATNSGSDSAIAIFMSTLLEAGEDVIGMVLRAFEGLTDAIAALITNPLKPQLALIAIIEAMRDVVIQLLDLIETFVNGFLDIVGAAIQQLKDMINAPINIPFVSALFKLLGAGNLTILNVTTLLLAIPITVVSKLAFGQKPFQGMATPDFAGLAQPGLAALSARSLSASQDEPAKEASEPDLQSIKDDVRSFGIAQLTLDTISGIFTAILDATAIGGKKKGQNEQNSSGSLERISAGSSGSGSSSLGDKVISFMELASIVIDGISFQFSFAAFTLLADTDYNSAAAKRKERRERAMQIYRLIVLLLDSVVALGPSADGSKRRMKRHEKQVTLFFTGLAFLDLVITSFYLDAIPKDDGRGLEVANEVVALLPDLLSPMRLSGPKGTAALVVVDGVATLVTLGIGSKLLAADVAELEEAIQAA